MPTKKIGLYIGKFQPFHRGHLFAIKNILPDVTTLIIVIGSSQYSGMENQPFSVRERREMIDSTLSKEGIENFSIVEIPDIHDNENWVEHVRTYVKHFDVVFTNNDLVKQLFTDKGFEVHQIKMLSGISGTLIRQKLVSKKGGDWIELVPNTTATIIRNSHRYL